MESRLSTCHCVLAGPYATQMLSDLGAEVIKVEAPWGDDTRKWGPPFTTGFDGKKVAAYFLSCNRGKEIININLKQETEKLKSLIFDADVIVENFRLDISYNACLEVCPTTK